MIEQVRVFKVVGIAVLTFFVVMPLNIVECFVGMDS